MTRSVYLCILLANAGNPPDLTRISPKCGGEGEGLKAEGKLLRKCVPITQAGEEGRRKEGTHICLSEPGRATLEPDLAAGETGSRTVS